MTEFRIRIKEHKVVCALELQPNKKNPRRHPAHQSSALRRLLDQVGFVDEIKVVELPDGKYKIVDGHLRTGVAEDALVPIAVLDLTAEEVDFVISSLDPIGAMAKTDPDAMSELVKGQSKEYQTALDEILARSNVHDAAFMWRSLKIENLDTTLERLTENPAPAVEGGAVGGPTGFVETVEPGQEPPRPMSQTEKFAAKLENRANAKSKLFFEYAFDDRTLVTSAFDAANLPKEIFLVEASRSYLKGDWSIPPEVYTRVREAAAKQEVPLDEVNPESIIGEVENDKEEVSVAV